MSRQLDPTDEELLQSALSTSFTRLPPRPATPTTSSQPTEPTLQAAPSEPEPTPASEAGASSAAASSSDDSWKDEYERHLAEWRAEAEVARQKAERTRAEWEARRLAEEEEQKRLDLEERERRAQEKEWETVSPAEDSKESIEGEEDKPPVPGSSLGGGTGPSPGDEKATEERLHLANAAAAENERKYGKEFQEPLASPADARDLVSGEQPRTHGQGLETISLAAGLESASESTLPVLESGLLDSSSAGFSSRALPEYHGGQQHDLSATTSDAHWEEIPSLASSFPSLNEPDHSSSSSAAPGGGSRQRPLNDNLHIDDVDHHRHHHHQPHAHHQHHQPARPAPPPSLTTSIFSPDLTPRARALALISSLAINMFLPFVNGVMLGFGEIFAHKIVGPFVFGLKTRWWPRSAPGNVGIRATSGGRRNETEEKVFRRDGL